MMRLAAFLLMSITLYAGRRARARRLAALRRHASFITSYSDAELPAILEYLRTATDTK